MNDIIKFIIKVTIAHFVSYLICGLIYSKLFNYEVLFKLDNVQYFMRDAYGHSCLTGPFVQIIRGALIGCILLILKDNLLTKKNSWLYLWIIFQISEQIKIPVITTAISGVGFSASGAYI